MCGMCTELLINLFVKLKALPKLRVKESLDHFIFEAKSVPLHYEQNRADSESAKCN